MRYDQLYKSVIAELLKKAAKKPIGIKKEIKIDRIISKQIKKLNYLNTFRKEYNLDNGSIEISEFIMNKGLECILISFSLREYKSYNEGEFTICKEKNKNYKIILTYEGKAIRERLGKNEVYFIVDIGKSNVNIVQISRENFKNRATISVEEFKKLKNMELYGIASRIYEKLSEALDYLALTDRLDLDKIFQFKKELGHFILELRYLCIKAKDKNLCYNLEDVIKEQLVSYHIF